MWRICCEHSTVPNLFDKVQESRTFLYLLILFESMRQYGTNMEHYYINSKDAASSQSCFGSFWI